MRSRLVLILIFWLLALATFWVAEPYFVAAWWSASTPRTVAPRADLSSLEKSTISIFRRTESSCDAADRCRVQRAGQ